MYSKIPMSMEQIPRSSGFLCLSLKFGAILTALLFLVYSTLGIAVSVASLSDLPASPDRVLFLANLLLVGLSHVVSFLLSLVLLIGLLKDLPGYVKPWITWTTVQTLAFVSLFIMSAATDLFRHTPGPLAVYLVELLVLGLRMYMLVLVVSYYKEMKEREEDEEKFRQLMSKESWYSPI